MNHYIIMAFLGTCFELPFPPRENWRKIKYLKSINEDGEEAGIALPF
jgi:hypothetical protein